ncbi:hypothetical protein OH76DRAFT_373234 [Lentinus brumalis]|uniref:Uncharacterized protein n=1 Tax=Lentinus brumalis TaxID=2498619 RepID=A0A371DEE6_9APHY|nr:hypothetical protein OH76DRAFT_373234 [Polyporus brumalis]
MMSAYARMSRVLQPVEEDKTTPTPQRAGRSALVDLRSHPRVRPWRPRSVTFRTCPHAAMPKRGLSTAHLRTLLTLTLLWGVAKQISPWNATTMPECEQFQADIDLYRSCDGPSSLKPRSGLLPRFPPMRRSTAGSGIQLCLVPF